MKQANRMSAPREAESAQLSTAKRKPARAPERIGSSREQTRRTRRHTISWAAREAGVNVETIRYYERLGLIARPIAAAGYRQYPEKTIERIRFIKRAQEFGFRLKEIGRLAGMAEADASCEDLCRQMEQKIDDLNAEIHRLSRLRDELRSLVCASPRSQASGSSGDCAALARMAGLPACDPGETSEGRVEF